MDLPIVAFEIMAEIVKENKIRGTNWAKAAGIEQSRISEYKRMAKQTKAGADDPAGEREVTGHILSLNNFFSL